MQAELLSVCACLQGFPSIGGQHIWLCPGMSPPGSHHLSIGRIQDPKALALGKEAGSLLGLLIASLIFPASLPTVRG